MLDLKEIDNYFNADSAQPQAKPETESTRHSHFVHIAKRLLPSIAAILIGLLLIFPSLKKDLRDIHLDITKPKPGELEKLHIENTVFYITDEKNRVNNFVAEDIDETEPASKIVKLSKPEGIILTSETVWTNVKSRIGYYNQNTNLMELRENVELFYSEGMMLETAEAFYDFKAGRGYGNQPVHAQGFLGDMDSEGFEFLNNEEILAFTGHTKIRLKENALQRKN